MTVLESKLISWIISIRIYLKKNLRNRYQLTLFVFFVWMIFFDNDSFYVQAMRQWQIHKIEKEIKFYSKQLEETRMEEKALTMSPSYFEKFVREKYLLKRANEDIFIFSPE